MATSVDEIIELANSLLEKLPGERCVQGLSDLNAGFYALLYEGLFAEPLPDGVSPATSREDEIHNAQAVIDALSMDKINTSMSHISGQALIAREPIAIHNILQVFDWLYEYMLEKISEASSATPSVADLEEQHSLLAENVHSRSASVLDDPDLVTPELIDDVLKRELNRATPKSEISTGGHSTAELIALGQHSSAQEMTGADGTSELIALGESRYSLSPPKRGPRGDTAHLAATTGSTEKGLQDVSAGKGAMSSQLFMKENDSSVAFPEKASMNSLDSSAGRFDGIGALPRSEPTSQPNYTVAHHLYHHYGSQPTDGSSPDPAANQRAARTIDTQTTPSVQQKVEKKDSAVSPLPSPPKSPQPSYERLHSLVADTVSLSRAALSPPQIRRHQPQQQQQPQSILSPGKSGSYHQPLHDRSNRKVSFVTSRGLVSSDDNMPSSTDTSTDLSSFIRRHGGQPKPKRSMKPQKKSKKKPEKQENVAFAATMPPPVQRSSVATDEEEDAYHSDGCVHYGADSEDDDDGRGFLQELRAYKQALDKRAKHVRFDDILDNKAHGNMGPLRRKLLDEDRKARKQTEFLRDRYEDEVDDYEEALKEELQKLYDAAQTKDSDYKKKVFRQPRTNKYVPQNKYSVPRAGAATSVLYPGRDSRPRRRRTRSRKRSASASPHHLTARGVESDDLLPFLLEEFPYLHLSTETLHDMWKKSSTQIQMLANSEKETRTKKTKAMQQLEEAEDKHKVLLEMMKKEVKHTAKMREVEERRHEQQAVKASIRDKRIASARCRRYYEEYQVRMRAKKLKRRTKEEQMFKQLFLEGLNIQKERIREVRRYAREQRAVKAEKNKNQVDSIENYYRDQFAMLSEVLNKEKDERKIRDKAQTAVVQNVQRDMRRKLEREVQDIQEQICKDEDDIYFRELDAQRLRTKLRMATFGGAV